MKDLQSLMARIAELWNCDSGRYPATAIMTEEQRRIFLLKHSLLHIAKTAAKIAAVCENFDHAGETRPDDRAGLEAAAVKMFVNALKLAEEAGLSAEDLLTRAPSYVK